MAKQLRRLFKLKMTKDQFNSEIQKRAESVDLYFHQYFEQLGSNIAAIDELKNSIYYSITSGGKRFRPLLSILVSELYQIPRGKVLPFACALEMIHTYSLIHDDLPCMDNDQMRRGKPTNHIVYGEATALLAGDSLLTEAFFAVSESYKSEPMLANKLIQMLSLAAGLRGMIAGQALDMKMPTPLSFDYLNLLHQLKTGRLIRLAVEGAAEVCFAPSTEIAILSQFGESLGLAFQVADDLLDADNEKDQGKSFVSLLGKDGTKEYLKKISDHCLQLLTQLSKKSELLVAMVDYNLKRDS